MPRGELRERINAAPEDCCFEHHQDLVEERGVQPLSAPVVELRILPPDDGEQPGNERRAAARDQDLPAMPQEGGSQQWRGKRMVPMPPVSRLEASRPAESRSRNAVDGDSRDGKRLRLIPN